jgi:ElaB/YqjD/DUF883 family membrane-anchored ribosome-binding protein
MRSEESIEQICADLDQIAERLDDLVLELLRDAVRNKAEKRPELERRATRARRAIERATIALRGATVEEAEDD